MKKNSQKNLTKQFFSMGGAPEKKNYLKKSYIQIIFYSFYGCRRWCSVRRKIRRRRTG
jgi:hypothetical protein